MVCQGKVNDVHKFCDFFLRLPLEDDCIISIRFLAYGTVSKSGRSSRFKPVSYNMFHRIGARVGPEGLLGS